MFIAMLKAMKKLTKIAKNYYNKVHVTTFLNYKNNKCKSR